MRTSPFTWPSIFLNRGSWPVWWACCIHLPYPGMVSDASSFASAWGKAEPGPGEEVEGSHLQDVEDVVVVEAGMQVDPPGLDEGPQQGEKNPGEDEGRAGLPAGQAVEGGPEQHAQGQDESVHHVTKAAAHGETNVDHETTG